MMKKTMMMGLAIAISTGMVGCNGIKGTLTVTKPLTLVNKKGQRVVADGGQHDTELTINGSANELKLAIKNVAGKKQKIDIKMPKGEYLPREQGDILIKGSEVGQPFDIKASLATETTESPQVRENVACQFTETATECKTVPVDTPNGGKRLEQQCQNVQIIHTGYREVDSHTVYTDTGAHAAFLDPATGEELAVFDGAHNTSDNVIDYQGPCVLER